MRIPLAALASAAACLLALSQPLAAKDRVPQIKVPPGAQIIVCEMKEVDHGHWIMPQIVVMVLKSGEVLVYDAVIDQFAHQPLPARILTDNARRTTYGWDVKATQKQGAPDATLSYRLTVQKPDNAARISMMPVGFSNTFQGTGRCAPKK